MEWRGVAVVEPDAGQDDVDEVADDATTHVQRHRHVRVDGRTSARTDGVGDGLQWPGRGSMGQTTDRWGWRRLAVARPGVDGADGGPRGLAAGCSAQAGGRCGKA